MDAEEMYTTVCQLNASLRAQCEGELASSCIVAMSFNAGLRCQFLDVGLRLFGATAA
jgi:hypothetical protein